MTHTARTLALDDDWDVSVDEAGYFRLRSGALAIAQACANEIRLWRNDAYFAADSGIEWLEVQLAQKLGEASLASVLREACLKVDSVASVDSITIDALDPDTRTLTGEITITTTDGETASVSF